MANRPFSPPLEDSPVTMLELFFDLVFVYVITQITTLVTEGSGWAGYGRAALVLSLTWYIYNGFSWLTNNVAPTTLGTRLPMFAAMAGFLAMAVVVPDAFGAGAWVFGTAYLAVMVIHAVQFARSSLGTSAQAIRATVPVNMTVAALILVAAVVGLLRHGGRRTGLAGLRQGAGEHADRARRAGLLAGAPPAHLWVDPLRRRAARRA